MRVGLELVAVENDLAKVFGAFAAHAEFWIAQRAPAHLFVHAGVVGWQDSAILIPGRSCSGKTTLVRAFLGAGATYYSDEYAVLDRDGHVHPYPRPLAVRRETAGHSELVSAAALRAQTGIDALPVGLILMTTYRLGACWRPQRLTPAQMLLGLMANAVAAQGSPAHSMPILRRAVARARGLKGARGEATTLLKDLSWVIHGSDRNDAARCDGQLS